MFSFCVTFSADTNDSLPHRVPGKYLVESVCAISRLAVGMNVTEFLRDSGLFFSGCL